MRENTHLVYGPPGCLAGDQMIAINRAGKGYQIRLDDLVDRFNGGTGRRGGKRFDLSIPTRVQRAEGSVVRLGLLAAAWESGVKPTLTLRTAQGRRVTATAEHPFLTDVGWSQMGDLKVGDYLMVNAGKSARGRRKPQYDSRYTRFHPHQRRAKGGWRYWTHRLTVEAGINGMTLDEFLHILRTDEETSRRMSFLGPAVAVHHKDHDWTNNHPDNLEILSHKQHRAEHSEDWSLHVLDQVGTDQIISIEPFGEIPTFDLEVADDPHNFLVNGVVVHNTGKTTFIAGSVREEVTRNGPTGIMISSFTRAAAAEIAGRDLPIRRDQVGTLHSFAFHALGRPELVVDNLQDWNDYVLSRDEPLPNYVLTAVGSKGGLEDAANAVEAGFNQTKGDEIMAKIEILRARRVPLDKWPAVASGMYRQWEAWKTATGLLDFTDLIERARLDAETAPGRPRIGWFDEVQDFTPLELALVRHWGESMDEVTLVGDDDQTLYHFKGSVPDEFLDPTVPEENKRVLEQSYRLPRAVHARAVKWIEELGERRQPKAYRPRDAEGLVREDGPAFGYKNMKTNPKLLGEIQEQVRAGRTVMLMASTSFMLTQLIAALRAEGIPFHNPWRRTQGAWNPLRSGRGTSSAERLLAYLVLDERIFGEASREWTGEDVKKWTNVVRKEVFQRGATKIIQGLPERTLAYEEVAQLFDNEETLALATEPNLDWFKRNLTATAAKTMTYPLAIANTFGPMTLQETPKVIIGTIHSLKGSQADVVYLSPDLSPIAKREMASGRYGGTSDARDAVRRMFYVGMTRAREELVLCKPSSWNYEETL